jgi:ferredoxin
MPTPEPVIPEPAAPVTPFPDPISAPPAPAETPAPATPTPPTVPDTTVPAAPIATTPPASGGSVYEGKGKGKYKVVVIKDKCIGAASCIAVSPKTFKFDSEQIAEVIPTVIEETDENLLLAAQSCPTLAIEVYDTTTNEKVWPK